MMSLLPADQSANDVDSCALEDAPNSNSKGSLLNFKLNEPNLDNNIEKDLNTINVWVVSKGRYDATLNVSSSKVWNYELKFKVNQGCHF